jgi:hypothetical protein
VPLTHTRTHRPAPPTVEQLDGPPSTLRRPLALVDGRAYAAAWLYARFSRSESCGARGYIVKHDPQLITDAVEQFPGFGLSSHHSPSSQLQDQKCRCILAAVHQSRHFYSNRGSASIISGLFKCKRLLRTKSLRNHQSGGF